MPDGPEGDDDLTDIPGNPRILRRDEHGISRRDIDSDALKVMYRLIRHGYRAFLVGGAVRDLLLGKAPKDFDIGTDAKPETVRSLFRNSRLIGRRFKINHVYFHGNKILEVSTFRAEGKSTKRDGELLVVDDNQYGDPESDAFRRDLTINGLFYDLRTFSVIDYVDGIRDLDAGVIRTIGDPHIRFQEDPVRMIRVVRHAARTGFSIDPDTASAIVEHAALIHLCPKARVWEESIKDIQSGSALQSFRVLQSSGLLSRLYPVFAGNEGPEDEAVWERLTHVLSSVDRLVRKGEEISPGVVFAGLLIGNLSTYMMEMIADCKPESIQRFFAIAPTAGDSQIEPQAETVDIDADAAPKRRRRRRGISSARRGIEGISSAEQSRIGKAIQALFASIGITRREVERMEELLVLRYRLFTQPEGDTPLDLVEHPLIDEVVTLLGISAHDEVSHATFMTWEAMVGKRSYRVEEYDPPPERRRRRRRRRNRR